MSLAGWKCPDCEHILYSVGDPLFCPNCHDERIRVEKIVANRIQAGIDEQAMKLLDEVLGNSWRV